MQNWIESEFFGHWKDVHSRITRCLIPTGPNVGFSQSAADWQKPATRLMGRLGELVVRQSLAFQAGWIDQWIRQFNAESVDLQVFSERARTINHAMHDWSRIQQDLWKFWFDLLDNAPGNTGDPDPNLEKLITLKRLIKEAGADLDHWLTKWEEQINCKPLVPVELNRLIRKLGQEMLGWIRNQAILWQYGFDLIHCAGSGHSQVNPSFPNKIEINSGRDDFTEISEIGPFIEQLLNVRDTVHLPHETVLSNEEIAQLENNVIRVPCPIPNEESVH